MNPNCSTYPRSRSPTTDIAGLINNASRSTWGSTSNRASNITTNGRPFRHDGRADAGVRQAHQGKRQPRRHGVRGRPARRRRALPIYDYSYKDDPARRRTSGRWRRTSRRSTGARCARARASSTSTRPSSDRSSRWRDGARQFHFRRQHRAHLRAAEATPCGRGGVGGAAPWLPQNGRRGDDVPRREHRRHDRRAPTGCRRKGVHGAAGAAPERRAWSGPGRTAVLPGCRGTPAAGGAVCVPHPLPFPRSRHRRLQRLVPSSVRRPGSSAKDMSSRRTTRRCRPGRPAWRAADCSTRVRLARLGLLPPSPARKVQLPSTICRAAGICPPRRQRRRRPTFQPHRRRRLLIRASWTRRNGRPGRETLPRQNCSGRRNSSGHKGGRPPMRQGCRSMRRGLFWVHRVRRQHRLRQGRSQAFRISLPSRKASVRRLTGITSNILLATERRGVQERRSRATRPGNGSPAKLPGQDSRSRSLHLTRLPASRMLSPASPTTQDRAGSRPAWDSG